jgi:excisionase family DNA binding protein
MDETPMDPGEVAGILGVSEKTVYRLMQEHRLAYSQVAKRKRVVTRTQLDDYIASTTVPAQAV